METLAVNDNASLMEKILEIAAPEQASLGELRR
jgi:hypothetical protein